MMGDRPEGIQSLRAHLHRYPSLDTLGNGSIEPLVNMKACCPCFFTIKRPADNRPVKPKERAFRTAQLHPHEPARVNPIWVGVVVHEFACWRGLTDDVCELHLMPHLWLT